MGTGQRVVLVIGVMMLPACQAAAQTLPCVAQFAELRDDVQQRGLAAMAAGRHKVSREEMCKHITAYSAAELKWIQYTEASVASCAIPAELVSQLKQVHSNTEHTKEKICAADVHDGLNGRIGPMKVGPSAAPPSLRD